MATDKPLPNPLQQEFSPILKPGQPLSYALDHIVRMPSVAGGYVDLLTPTDTVLKQKGGTLDVYREVLRDDQVKSTFQQRRTAVTSAPWSVDPGDDSPRSKQCAEALAANLARIGYDRITDRMLYSLFYGFGVGEVMYEVRDNLIQVQDVRVRDRARFKFGIDRELYLYQPDGRMELMPPRKFWSMCTGADHDDEPYGMGLAHWLYWPTYFKRNGLKFWLIFLEKFGMPTAKATLAPGQMNNKELVNKALQALREIQTDGGVVVPEGVAIELIEIARSGAVDYASMYDAMDRAISKIVLSQTMTTDNGSSRSQAQVHKTVADTVAQSDSDLICESFNNTIAAWFRDFNFADAAAPRVYRSTQPPDDLAVRAERDVKVKSLGFEPTEAYILETYGPGWIKAQQAAALAGDIGALPGGGAAGGSFGGAGAVPDADAETAQAFAETAALAALKNANRADQRALLEAAAAFGQQWDTIVGERVRTILAYAEESGDYDTMREHLNALAAERAPRAATEKVRRSTFVARLMGALRGQRED